MALNLTNHNLEVATTAGTKDTTATDRVFTLAAMGGATGGAVAGVSVANALVPTASALVSAIAAAGLGILGIIAGSVLAAGAVWYLVIPAAGRSA